MMSADLQPPKNAIALLEALEQYAEIRGHVCMGCARLRGSTLKRRSQDRILIYGPSPSEIFSSNGLLADYRSGRAAVTR